jgi:hypothetical protein
MFPVAANSQIRRIIFSGYFRFQIHLSGLAVEIVNEYTVVCAGTGVSTDKKLVSFAIITLTLNKVAKTHNKD